MNDKKDMEAINRWESARRAEKDAAERKLSALSWRRKGIKECEFQLEILASVGPSLTLKFDGRSSRPSFEIELPKGVLQQTLINRIHRLRQEIKELVNDRSLPTP